MGSIHDVAEKAGCSLKTVSRVFNNPDSVKAETLERILAVAKSLHYEPNFHARGLKTQKTMTIGLVLGLPDSDVNRIRIDTITRLFSTAGYSMLVNRINNIDEEAALLPAMNQRCDAIIIFTTLTTANLPIYDYLLSEGTPFLLVDPACTPNYPHIIFKRGMGYKEAVMALAKNGKRKFKLLIENYRREDRIGGFKAGLRECGIDFVDDMVITCEKGFSGGYERGPTIHAAHNIGEADAVLCHNDKIAMGLMNYLNAKGLNIPHQVAITGFDNENYGQYTSPRLTTIDQGGHRVGLYIYEQLFGHLQTGREIQSKTFDTSLVLRESS